MIAEKASKVAFTEGELNYLAQSRLGRIATVSKAMEPHVVPVVYEFDGNFIYFSGWHLTRSLKFHNIIENNKVAFVVDDVPSLNPWRARGIEIRGAAEIIKEEGQSYVRVTPRKKSSWGLEAPER
jgi:pyridoxamine 5'-phosphate oxidase family protein